MFVVFSFRWEDNNKMDLGEIGWGSMDWIHLAPDGDYWRAVVNTVMNFFVSKNFEKLWSGRATGGFSRRTELCGFNELLS
jgi:hypothetical protein